jgi:hypothetical protein
LAGGVVDDDTALRLSLAIEPRAVRDPGAPRRAPVGEDAGLGAVVVLEALELGERATLVPSCFLGGMVC